MRGPHVSIDHELATAILYFVGGVMLAWLTHEVRAIWRERPPVVRGEDGHWRGQRGIGRIHGALPRFPVTGPRRRGSGPC